MLAVLLIAACAQPFTSGCWRFLPPFARGAAAARRRLGYSRNGKLLYEVVDPRAGKQIDLTLANIPKACVKATIATEDERFFSHFGVDPIAIVRAVWQNLNGRTVVSGGSTLTQQLARTLLLSADERYEQSAAPQAARGVAGLAARTHLFEGRTAGALSQPDVLR